MNTYMILLKKIIQNFLSSFNIIKSIIYISLKVMYKGIKDERC
jgi:hypothetical protein